MTRFSPLPPITTPLPPDLAIGFPLPITTLPPGYRFRVATEESAQRIENIGEFETLSVATLVPLPPRKNPMNSTASTLPPPPKGGGVCLATHTPPTIDRIVHCQSVARPDPVTKADIQERAAMTQTALVQTLSKQTADWAAVLALDLGTTTGWALRAMDGRMVSGTHDFRPRRFEGGGMRYLRFTDWLVELAMLSKGIRRVVFEEVRRHVGTDAAHIYGGFLGALTSWCEQHQIPYQGVPVGTIKRHVTGKGNASKDAVISAVTARGFDPADDNEADAIAILLWAIETMEGAR